MTSKTFNRSAMLDQKTSLKALSFFSGCMGLDLGLEQEGIEILLACENDFKARNTIKFNRPDMVLIEDINQYSAAEIREKAGLSPTEEIDLIVGTPPRSVILEKQGFGERGNLFSKFVDLITELQPKFIVIETCPRLLYLSSQHSPNSIKKVSHPTLSQDKEISDTFSFIIRKLEAAGYGVSFNLYNAADFGSSQLTGRVFITCSRDGKELPYLTPTHANNGLNGLPKWQTLRDAIEEISGDEHSYNELSKLDLKNYQLLKPGQNWQNLPAELQQEVLQRLSSDDASRKVGFYRRLAWDKPSPTLLPCPGNSMNSLVHPEVDRPLSIEEYKRIQDLPDDWQINGNVNSQYRQISNATPCSLGRAIAKMLLAYVYGEPLSDFAYKEEIKKRFDSLKTIEEWEKEMASANLYNRKEIYIQIAISRYLEIMDLSNEMEVNCGKYKSDRLDIIIQSEKIVIEVKKIINKKSLSEGVSQLNTYAKNTGMTRKILIGLPDLREHKKAEIKELIEEYIKNHFNLEIYTLDLEQEDLGLKSIFHQQQFSKCVRNILDKLNTLLENLIRFISDRAVNGSKKTKQIVTACLTGGENLLGVSQVAQSY